MSQLDIALHPKQTIAYQSQATEILYGGAAGGGKSHLMRCLALMMACQVPGIQIYIFRRLSGDLVKNHIEGPSGFNALLMGMYESKHARYNGGKNEITFWNGSKIFLCHCQHEKDRFKYQGAEMHILMIDELTHFTEKIYRFLRSRVRMAGLKVPEEFKNKLPFILNGSNPGNVGHSWVKRTFVTSAPYGEIHRADDDEGGMLRQYIPALLSDNPNLGEDYATQLKGMGSPDQVKAMLNGDWDIVMGGAMDDLWSRDKQVIPRFWIPKHWYVDRSFDWGSTHPFSVGWWAVSDGEEVDRVDGQGVLELPANSLIRFHEWYGTKLLGTNVGLKTAPHDIAKGIIERQELFKSTGLYKGRVNAGPADNQIWSVNDPSELTIAKKMEKHKVRWTRSNKKAGSRINGLQMTRDMLQNTLKGENGGIYFTNNCLAAIGTLPILPRDEKKPDDVDTTSEDHPYDEVRYRVLAHGSQVATGLKVGFTY